ncbi:hypothetical protein NDU88_009026 [Pleurodeles waltl]|uniref:Uncharacterized protein n=1 Tax=Pleurodeles waltl TaxID=8319 RepID=A0AAV7RXD8_PLEWA|nr:hypothetical protein NDU88_009026 [Pleurodeles waltl]
MVLTLVQPHCSARHAEFRLLPLSAQGSQPHFFVHSAALVAVFPGLQRLCADSHCRFSTPTLLRKVRSQSQLFRFVRTPSIDNTHLRRVPLFVFPAPPQSHFFNPLIAVFVYTAVSRYGVRQFPVDA